MHSSIDGYICRLHALAVEYEATVIMGVGAPLWLVNLDELDPIEVLLFF